MRRIAFRAWDKEKKSMGFPDKFPYIFFGIYPNGKIFNSKTREDLSKRFILMQFIGLKDKKGKPIFEGDICKYEDEIVSIVWWNKYACWAEQYKQELDGFEWINLHNRMGLIDEDREKVYEIIGNIYENPELFDTKKNL